MSEYGVCDFEETLSRINLEADPFKVLYAHGLSGDGCEWEGGFVLLLDNARFAYIWGWCDYTGWGCQDGVKIQYSDTLEGLEFDPSGCDEEPADLNIWIRKNYNW